MTRKDAVIVARVSTDEQAERGYSLRTQLAAMRKYAEGFGLPIHEEIVDDCSGAIPIADRPGGKRLYALADSGKIGAVIFYTLDRTARDEKVIEYLLLKSYLNDRGIELHYADTGLDPYTTEGNLIGYSRAHAAADERCKIAERSIRGRNAKANNGRWVGTGFTAYGFARQGQKREARVVVDVTESAVVRKIYTWFVTGDESGNTLSLRGIALRLQAEKIPPPAHRKITANRWKPTTVRGILMNEIYTGRIYYGKTRIVNKKKVQQPHDQWILAIDAPDLAIIGSGLFEAAQARFAINQKLARRNSKHEYLLSGFFRCGGCGNVMAGTTGSVKSKTTTYEKSNYCCGQTGISTCSHVRKTISCRKVDTIAWNWLLDALSPSKLDEGLKNWHENSEARIGQGRAILANMQNEEAKAERRIKRLVTAIADSEDDPAAALTVELNQATKQWAALAAERAKREAELANVALTPERETGVRAAAAAVRARFGNANFAQKREMFAMLSFKAKFYDDEKGRRLWVYCELREDVLPLCSRATPQEGANAESALSHAGFALKLMPPCDPS